MKIRYLYPGIPVLTLLAACGNSAPAQGHAPSAAIATSAAAGAAAQAAAPGRVNCAATPLSTVKKTLGIPGLTVSVAGSPGSLGSDCSYNAGPTVSVSVHIIYNATPAKMATLRETLSQAGKLTIDNSQELVSVLPEGQATITTLVEMENDLLVMIQSPAPLSAEKSLAKKVLAGAS